MPKQLSRRDLLKAGAGSALGLALSGPAAALLRQEPKDGPRFAIVGVQGMGGANRRSAAQFGPIVGLCDVDAKRRAEALVEHPGASTFADFRDMLEALRDEIDAVVLSTPDHTHAVAAAMAMKMGKHVYCEKPLTRTVWEARELAKLARSRRVATQMGNWGTGDNSFRKAEAALRAGVIGKPVEIHCWTDRPIGFWPQGVERPAPSDKPGELDWDLWLGPAPERPYAGGYHPFAWRGWWDFGTGSLGDMGCHGMNLPVRAFDLRDPMAVTATTSGHERDSFPAWGEVVYEFGPRGGRPAVKLFWYDGGRKPSAELMPGVSYGGNGCIMVGTEDTFYTESVYGSEGRLKSGKEIPEVPYDASPGHFAEFVQAIKGGPAPKSNFPDFAAPLTETVLLGNLAIWAPGERLEWDARGMRVKGREDLNPLLKPTFREGWRL